MSTFSMYVEAWHGPLYLNESMRIATVWLPYTCSLCDLPDKLKFSTKSTVKNLLENIIGENQLCIGTNTFTDRNLYIYPVTCDEKIFPNSIDLGLEQLDYISGIYGSFSSTTSTNYTEMLLVPECEELENRLLFMPGSIPHPRLFIVIIFLASTQFPIEHEEEIIQSYFNSPIHDQLFTSWEDNDKIYSPRGFEERSNYLKPKKQKNANKAPKKIFSTMLYDTMKLPNVKKNLLQTFSTSLRKKQSVETNHYTKSKNKKQKKHSYFTKHNFSKKRKWYNGCGSKVLSSFVVCKRLSNSDFYKHFGQSEKNCNRRLRLTGLLCSDMVLKVKRVLDKICDPSSLQSKIKSFYNDKARAMSNYGSQLVTNFPTTELNSIGYASFINFTHSKKLLKKLCLINVSQHNIEEYGGLAILSEEKVYSFIGTKQSKLINKDKIQFAVSQCSNKSGNIQIKKIFHVKSMFLLHHSVLIDKRFGEFCEFVFQENQNEHCIVIIPIKTLEFVLKLFLIQQHFNRDFYTVKSNLFSLSSLIRGGWCIMAPYENVGPSSSLDTLLECAKDLHNGFDFAHKEVNVVIGRDLSYLSTSSGYYKILNL